MARNPPFPESEVTTTEFAELERKYSAEHVEFRAFSTWIQSNRTQGLYNIGVQRRVQGEDHFFRRGNHVVRYRFGYNNNYNAFTVKVRTSNDSIENRHEVDLLLHAKVDLSTVTEFMRLTGYKWEFSLWKDALIFDIDDTYNKVKVFPVIYDVARISGYLSTKDDHVRRLPVPSLDLSTKRRFIEVEVEKDPTITINLAKATLDIWDQEIRKGLVLEPALNLSLYENYSPSKKRYRVMKNA